MGELVGVETVDDGEAALEDPFEAVGEQFGGSHVPTVGGHGR